MNRRKGVPCGCDADPCGCSPKNHCVKAINNVSPDPNGDFTIAAGDNVTIAEAENGIEIDADVGVKTVNGLSPDTQGNINIEDISTEFLAQGNLNVYFTTSGHTPYVSQRITVSLPASAEDMVSGYDYLVTASVLDEDTSQPVDDVTISLPYGSVVTPARDFTIDINAGEDIVIYWTLYRMKVTHTGLSKIFGAFPSSVTNQEKLVSGTNIKTINGNSLIGSGNITISSNDAVKSIEVQAEGTVLPDANGKITILVGTNMDIVTYPTFNQIAISSTATALTKKSHTLAAANWSNNQLTLIVTDMTTTTDVFVSPDPSDWSDYNAAGIRAVSQGTGTLTFECDTTPTTDIDVNLVIGRLNA